MPPEVRALAEDPGAHRPVSSGFERVLNDRFSVLLGPSPRMTSVMRLRLREQDVDPTVAEVRAIVAAHGHVEPTWWIGSSATPSDLVERLLALGFVPRTQQSWEPQCTAMACVYEPAAAAGVDIRRVENVADYLTAVEIEWEAFGAPEEHRREGRELAAGEYETMVRDGEIVVYLASIGSRPVGSAVAVPAEAGVHMIGGATLPEARGRGAYRALVRARWDDAVARGTPALVTQSGAMSRPILERLGFVAVAEVDVLLDAGFNT